MEYRYLGSSGLLVSRVCLGTMTFGQKDWGCDPVTAAKIIDEFIGCGGNFIDTADSYAQNESERIIGEALTRHERNNLVIATKCFMRQNPTTNARGLSRKHIFEACEASLKRLRTDYIDLYQIHGPDPHTPLEETMHALNLLISQGKVRYIGCCNHYAWHVVKANAIARSRNQEPFVCGQYLYNLIVRDVEREILPACHDQGMGFICWSPLASGMLSGKYEKTDKPDPRSRVHFRAYMDMPRYWHDRGFGIIEEVTKISKETGIPAARLALGWLLKDTRVSSVIIGARSIDQLIENCAVGAWDMPEEMHGRLSEAAAFDHGYPRQWIEVLGNKQFGDAEG